MSGHVQLWTLAELVRFSVVFVPIFLCIFNPGRHVPVPYYRYSPPFLLPNRHGRAQTSCDCVMGPKAKAKAKAPKEDKNAEMYAHRRLIVVESSIGSPLCFFVLQSAGTPVRERVAAKTVGRGVLALTAPPPSPSVEG